MKRLSYFLMTLVSVATVISCQKENAVDAPKGEPVVFTAYVDGAGSKTVFGEAEGDYVTSLWSGTEKMWVMDSEKNKSDNGWKKEYKAELETKSDFAVFSQTDESSALAGGPYMALYPKDPANGAQWTGTDDVTGLWLNNNQTLSLGGYLPEYHIAASYSSSTMLQFKNVVSFFKFEIDSDNISEVCIYSNNKEVKIAGNFKLGWDKEKDIPVVTPNGNVLSSYIKVDAHSVNLAKGVYYIAALPAEFSNGLSINLMQKGNLSTKSTSNTYILERNSIVDLGKISFPSDKTTTTVYLNPGPWTVEGAVLSAYHWTDGGSDGFVDFEDKQGDGRYEAEIPAGCTGYKFVRFDPKHAHDWKHKWNDTGDLTINSKNCLTVTKDSNGKWIQTTYRID